MAQRFSLLLYLTIRFCAKFQPINHDRSAFIKTMEFFLISKYKLFVLERQNILSLERTFCGYFLVIVQLGILRLTGKK